MTPPITVKGPTKQDRNLITLMDRETKDIFSRNEMGGENYTAAILKEEKVERGSPSNQDVAAEEKPHPFDMQAAAKFQFSNEHHSACIQTARDALVGMGHVTESMRKARKAKLAAEAGMAPGQAPTQQEEEEDVLSLADVVLNPLCRSTWQETQLDVAEDYSQLGNGYFEIVRKGSGSEITGIHHLPAAEVKVVVEDDQYNMHYMVTGTEPSSAGGQTRIFAAFGDKQGLLERIKSNAAATLVHGISDQKFTEESVSEVIHIRKPSSKSRWYGMPHWVAAAASIELVQMMMQHNFDFFLNRGVPELAAFFLGQKLPEEDWKKIEQAFMGQVGSGNSHKSIAANLAVDENFQVVIEKLAMESKDESAFGDIRENLALGIVSAHRVPPLLAGIQIPGKLGATNELPNALMAYQALVIGPQQRLWQQTLGSTLGDPELGVKGLSMKDFEYRKITEEIDVGSMDTVARMRQSPMQANAEGRDLKDGVKE